MRRSICLARAALFAGLLGLAASAGASPPYDELAERVRTIWGASRQAITSVECEYRMKVNSIDRRVVYRRDGARFYFASLDRTPRGGLGMPTEVAWDGQLATRRIGPDPYQLGQSPNRKRALDGRPCSSPEQELAGIPAYVLEVPPFDQGDPFQQVSSSEEDLDGLPCIKLVFRGGGDGRLLTFWHSRDDQYWPVRIEGGLDSFGYSSETYGVEFHRETVDGNTLIYPIRHVGHSGTTASGRFEGNEFEWVVDPATLKVNQPIPVEKFRIEPFPNQGHIEIETQRWVAPADPNWTFPPPDQLGFPWGPVVEAIAIVKKKQAEAGVVGGPQTMGLVGGPTATVPPPPREPAGILNLWMIGGLLVLLAAGGWMVYERRRMA